MGFETATLRMQGTVLATEPPHPLWRMRRTKWKWLDNSEDSMASYTDWKASNAAEFDL